MDKREKLLSHLSLMAACIAFLVIGLGAYTRLVDAGLGCPDWPGCYGKLLVPNSQQAILKANSEYPSHPLVASKAWVEMIHRYFAGILGLMILLIAGISIFVALKHGLKFLMIGLFLLAILIYQAILGMWTITLKLLPFIVSQHLFGGMTIFALLWLMYLCSKTNVTRSFQVADSRKFKPWVFFGLILVILQILLGAWTSANYAALSCPNFPFCQSNTIWHYNFQDAFNIFSPIGIDYQGGILNSAARMTIQMVHRFGALIVLIYLLALIVMMHLKVKQNKRLRKTIYFLIAILFFQIALGISNVLFNLPLSIALAHNLFAALLLITMITLNHQVFTKEELS